MKKTILAIIAFSALVLCSCEREDLSAFVGSSMTDDVTNVTSDSFEFHGNFTLDGGVATSSAIGIFMDTKPGVNSGQYFLTTSPVKMINGATSFSYNFCNIDKNTNERIFKAGTTVYYRAYLRVTDTDYGTNTYVYGDEKSFTVPISKCTLMVYGTGSDNLDYTTAKNLIVPMMKEGRDGDLQVTFQYKPSALYQHGGEYSSYSQLQGVHRWVMPYGTTFKDIWNENIETTEDYAEYTIYAYNRFSVFSEQVGDNDFNLSERQNLTSFINWSIEKCPAEKYILLMTGSASGWDFKNGQISDDNLDGSSMSLVDFTNAVSSSNVGTLDGVIFNENMMATLETLAATARISNNMLAPQESIYGLRGDMVVKCIRKSITSGYDTFNAFVHIVDEYCRENSDKYTDLGAYKLTETEEVISHVTEATSFLKDKYAGSTDWKTVIDKGISKALWSFGSNDGTDYRSLIFGLKGKMENWNTLSDPEKEQIIDDYAEINEKGCFQYCFHDFLAQIVQAAENYQPYAQDPDFSNEISALSQMLHEYYGSLKDMAFIDCGQKETGDTPYICTSPSVCLQSLAEGVYGPVTKDNLFGYARANEVTRNKAIDTYRSLVFDGYTGWSDLLTTIQTSAAPFFSDDRQFRQSGQ